MHHAVILAGGSGTRLWPASRRERPKQVLPIAHDDEPLIAAAVTLGREVADEVTIVVAESQIEATLAALPRRFTGRVIGEPVGRNTAAAIAMAGATIAEHDPRATIAVLPADQHVRDHAGMAAAIKTCLATAESTNTIALIGIPPTRAETGFGYLEVSQAPDDRGIRNVLRFIEKPDHATADRFITGGRHLWNAGIFCLTARRLLAELDAHLPDTARVVRQIVRDNGLVVDPRGLYEALPSISFDHAVMEKTDRIVAVAATVGWNDVGSWAALPEVRGIDENGNTIVGRAVVIDGSGNIAVSDDDTLVATIGLSDLVVVKSGDAVLVVRRDQAQRVREVVETLRTRGLSRYL